MKQSLFVFVFVLFCVLPTFCKPLLNFHDDERTIKCQSIKIYKDTANIAMAFNIDDFFQQTERTISCLNGVSDFIDIFNGGMAQSEEIASTNNIKLQPNEKQETKQEQ